MYWLWEIIKSSILDLIKSLNEYRVSAIFMILRYYGFC